MSVLISFGLFVSAGVCYLLAFFTLNQFADFQNDTSAFGIGPLRADGEYAKAFLSLAAFCFPFVLSALHKLGGIPHAAHSSAAPTVIAQSPPSPLKSDLAALTARVEKLEAASHPTVPA